MHKAIITALIPAYNEEKNIERCVRSVLWCDKVIVLWSGNDKTGELARKMGVEVINYQTKKKSFVAVQKSINWAVDNIKSDWFLRIDADEEVTEELKKEILITIKQNDGASAYGIPRNQYFWGGFLKGGDWYYDQLIRLFRKGSARYDPIIDVHEQFKVKGEIGYLKNRLNHYSHPTLSVAVDKFNLYTDMEAKTMKLTKAQARIKILTRPIYVFLRWFFYHHGYRDGLRGVVAGLMRAWYEFILYAKYLETGSNSFINPRGSQHKGP